MASVSSCFILGIPEMCVVAERLVTLCGIGERQFQKS